MRIALFLVLTSLIGPVMGQLPFTEDFSGGTLPVGWTTEDLSDNADPLLWQHCAAPTTCAPYTTSFTSETIFAAPSAHNGYLVADADAHGEQPAPYESLLSLPPIDCSGHAEIYLSFHTFIAAAALPAAEFATVEVRSDSGPWTSFAPFCTQNYPDQNTSSHNARRVVIDLSDIAAQQNAVEIRFRWRGNWEYSWSIDDLRVDSHVPGGSDVVWGTAPGEGDFAGGLNEWTAQPLSVPGSDQGWRWLSDGFLGNAYFAADTRHLESPTVCNGAMVLNADFYSTGGNTPIDPPYPVYVSELMSPIIDLSNEPTALTLAWYESVRLFQAAGGYPAPTLLAFSADGGATWSPPVELHPDLGLGEAREGWRSHPLPIGLSGSTTARFKFTFAAEFFWWAIDDVRLVRRPATDLALDPDYLALPPNAITPVSQVAPFRFLTDLENRGALSSTGTRLDVRVTDVASMAVLHRDSMLLGELASDTLLTDLVLPQSFTPSPVAGLYELHYRVGADSADQVPGNNAFSSRFQLSEATFAKERGATRAIAPTGGVSQYAYGNCFYLPNGEGFYGAAVSFGLANAEALPGEVLFVRLHEWIGDLNNNGLADADTEYQNIGINTYTVTGNEGDALVNVPLLPAIGDQVALKDDHYYLVSVEYGGTGTCFFQASEAYDYTATYVLTDSLEAPRYASVLKTDFSTNAYDLVGFGLDVVPVVRLHLSDTPVGTSMAPAAFPVSIYPNPTTRWLTWSAPFPAGSVRIDLFGSDGSWLHAFDTPSSSSLSLPDLATGLYWLRFVHPQGAATVALVVAPPK